MSDQPIRVLIVDDHAALSWSLAFVFAQEADLRVVARMAGPPARATAEGRCLYESFWIRWHGPARTQAQDAPPPVDSAADTTAPSITVLLDMTVEASAATGTALVSFVATATDDVDGDVAVACDPASDGGRNATTTPASRPRVYPPIPPRGRL